MSVSVWSRVSVSVIKYCLPLSDFYVLPSLIFHTNLLCAREKSNNDVGTSCD